MPAFEDWLYPLKTNKKNVNTNNVEGFMFFIYVYTQLIKFADLF